MKIIYLIPLFTNSFQVYSFENCIISVELLTVIRMKFNFESRFSIFDIKRGLKLPKKPSEELAEFLGIMYGDGYSGFVKSKNDYMISICGHSINDIEYHSKFVKKLFKNLFGITPKLIKRKGQKTIYTLFRSKGLYYFLLNMGFSSPKENLIIPEWVKNQKKFSFAFLRGFVDTDFSFNPKKVNEKRYLRITTAIKDRVLAEEIVKIFEKYGFSLYHKFDVKKWDKRGFTTTTNYIQMGGGNNVKKFLVLVLTLQFGD